jgi:hypothetical protein
MATIVVHFSTSASSLEPCHESWEKPYNSRHSQRQQFEHGLNNFDIGDGCISVGFANGEQIPLELI